MTKLKGKNSGDMQLMNKSLIIRFLLNSDIISRAELAKMSGLKQATITNIINDFIDWGLVKEVGLFSRDKGVRRSIGLEICKEKYKTISIRLSRNYATITVFDISGKSYEAIQCNVHAKENFIKTLEQIVNIVKEILISHKNTDSKFLGVGVALPGPWVDKKKQVAYFTGFYQWENINIADILEKEIELPVYIEQDANVALLAEYSLMDVSSTHASILCVMVGQGIGAAIMNNGSIVRGNIGMAGEIGHMSIQHDGDRCECGNIGCLEGFSSTSAIMENVKEMIKDNKYYGETVINNESKIDDVIKAYKEKDPLALKVVNQSAMYIGYALASLTNVINPEIIIIGDEMSRAGSEYLESIVNSIKDRVMPIVFENTVIQLSTFKQDPAVLGASQLVINESINQPMVFKLNK